MIEPFVHEALPTRVVFGSQSTSGVADEVLRLGAKRLLILCTASRRVLAQSIAERIGSAAVGIFDGALMHVPREVADSASAYATQRRADAAVAIGGGSTIGLGKAIALTTGLPIIAIPTTYSGSEMTPIYGITERATKQTGRDLRVLPKLVIYDPELSTALPVATSVTSGINAIAHAAEGLYSRDSNPIIALMAEEGIRALAQALPAIHLNPVDPEARTQALYGAWLCGTVLGQVGMALHHKLCHTLGGAFNLPHAETHAVILPHALAYNAAHAPLALARIARALNCADAPAALHALAKAAGAPTSLRELGLAAAELDRAVDLALSQPYWNPRPLERAGLRQLLQRAYDGTPAGTV